MNRINSRIELSAVESFFKTLRGLMWLTKVVFVALTIILIIIISFTETKAQTSGGWDAAGTTGTSGYNNWGSGVIQLMGSPNTGCAAAAVHETSSTYNPTSGVAFSVCYQVFFGCPGNDNIGNDIHGDGMAFSFSKCGYNINNGNACGGGLGYMGSCPQMITIEFDTWDSQGNAGFDGAYGGGTSGDHDEIAIHKDGDASDAGRITSVDAGNLEDGLEHTVCITYNPTTHILAVSIDGNTKLSYDLTGSPYDLPTYFGAGGLNQTWSSGKAGATNPATVSDGSGISATVGGPLCPASVVITSPATASVIDKCGGPVTITATATLPAANTITFVEFFVDGVSIGTDPAEPYDMVWNPVTDVHALTATAHYAPSNTTATSVASSVMVSPGIQTSFTAPAIDGLSDAIWSNYDASTLTKLPVGTISGPADLSATYKTMRDANNLYIFVSVTDDVVMNSGANPWDKDGVEIFIDMGNNKNTTFGANDFQYSFVTGPTTITEYKHNAIAGVVYAEGPNAGGYTIEISIPWTTLGGAPADDDLMGFDVHVNDDDNDGVRDSKIAWYDATDIAFHDPSGFGTIKISPCNPCPTGVLTGTNSICDDGVSTAPLSISFTGNGPWSFEYSIDGVTQPIVTGITTTPYVFQSGVGAHTYALVSVSNPFTSGCTGNATGTAAITLKTLPTAVTSGNFSICNDGVSTSPLSVNFTGTAPWSFTYAIDGITQTSVTGINTSPYVFQSATGAHVYTLVSASDALTSTTGCPATVSGTITITINNSATAVLSGDNSICNDGISTTPLSVGFTGTAPYSLSYAIDGVTQPFVSGINTSPYVFQSATGAHVYTLVSASDALTSTSACPAVVSGTVTITLNNSATAVLSGDNSICNDEISTSTLSASFTGTAPYSFSYAIDGITQPVVTGINTSPYVFQSATGAHVYTAVSTSDALTVSTGCPGVASGSATITVKNVPTAHDATFLVSGIATLSVGDIGGSYQWYDAATGGTLLSTGALFTTPILNDTTRYFVQEASNAPCRTMVTAFPLYPTTPFFIPNLITPNNDGKNDAFEIMGLPPNSVLLVYNRWGEMVYQNNNYDNLWAGGTVSDGVYYFDLMLPDDKQYKGWLHVVR